MSDKATSIPGSLPRERRLSAWTALACASIVAAAIAAYSNSFNGPFVFDDITAIRDNSSIRHFPARENLIPPLSNPISRRPVVNFTFALNCALDGLAVRGLHAGNLLIHLLAALTLFGVVRRTLMLPALRNRFGRASTALATAVALIWAVHPLQTESVTYLTQRTELLMGLLYLLTLYCGIRGALRERPWRWYAAAIAACALGMGSKEVMATAPIVVLLYDRAFLSGSFREALRRRWPLYLGLAATWGILGALLVAYPWGGRTGMGFGMAAAGPWEYARIQPAVILHYLRLSFWPQSLCLAYSWPIAATFRQVAPAAIVVLMLLAGTVWALRRAPALGFFGAWFFLILAPTSSFVPIITEVAAERRMYLPLAAIAAGAVIATFLVCERSLRHLAISEETRRRRAGGIAIGLMLAAAAVLGSLTFLRNEDYRTAITVWEDVTRKQPKNSHAWSNLGDAYVNASRYDDAIRSCNRALDSNPNFFEAYYNRGLAYAGLGRPTEALRDYDAALALNPDSAAVRLSRANAYESAGRSDLALRDYCHAVESDPNDALACNYRGVAYARAGRSDEALHDFAEAIRLNPKCAEAYNNRGNVYTRLGRLAEAIRDYDGAILLKADFTDAYYNRAIANGRLGRRDEAIRDYTQVLALNPENAAAYNGRGKAVADANRPAEAIRDFDQALALNPAYAEAYYNRGNARTDANHHSEAVEDYDKAIALKPGFASAYNNRAVAYYELKSFDKAWEDVNMFVRLGGRPDPGFLKALNQACPRPQDLLTAGQGK
jgi:protein O-mannosyl-transferase